MAYRDILVPMSGGGGDRARARFAADVAGRFGARLVGVYVKSQVMLPFVPPNAMVLLTEDEMRRIEAAGARTVDEAAERARETFESAAGDQSVTSEWRVVEDGEALVACARCTDLLVHSVEKERGDVFTPVELATRGGGPALILPSGSPTSKFKRVLLAWNGSQEAARAVHAAWPLIGLTERLDVLVVSRGGLPGPEGLLQRHLEHHGARPSIIVDESHDAAAGEVIRRQVAALEPDLVVMGLYGHSRLREFVMGGVTRSMLSDPPVPLLVSP